MVNDPEQEWDGRITGISQPGQTQLRQTPRLSYIRRRPIKPLLRVIGQVAGELNAARRASHGCDSHTWKRPRSHLFSSHAGISTSHYAAPDSFGVAALRSVRRGEELNEAAARSVPTRAAMNGAKPFYARAARPLRQATLTDDINATLAVPLLLKLILDLTSKSWLND